MRKCGWQMKITEMRSIDRCICWISEQFGSKGSIRARARTHALCIGHFGQSPTDYHSSLHYRSVTVIQAPYSFSSAVQISELRGYVNHVSRLPLATSMSSIQPRKQKYALRIFVIFSALCRWLRIKEDSGICKWRWDTTVHSKKRLHGFRL